MAGALDNDAAGYRPTRATPADTAVGDPTEGALVVAAAHAGIEKDDLDTAFPRVAEVPFDSSANA